eukprot:5980006-Amphidinium_carterae.1
MVISPAYQRRRKERRVMLRMCRCQYQRCCITTDSVRLQTLQLVKGSCLGEVRAILHLGQDYDIAVE